MNDEDHGVALPIHVILNGVKNLALTLQRIPILSILFILSKK
jgi:hypothetical protein